MQPFYGLDNWDLNQFIGMKFDRMDIWHMAIQNTSIKKISSKLWFSYCMECKFNYLQGNAILNFKKNLIYFCKFMTF